MASGRKKRGGTSVKKREAMSKFGARVEPNDQKPAFEHGAGMLGAAKLPIKGAHPLKMVKGRPPTSPAVVGAKRAKKKAS